MTEGQRNSKQAYDDVISSGGAGKKCDKLELFMKLFGPLTEADAWALLKNVDKANQGDKGCMAARLDEVRLRNGGLRKNGTKISASTGKKGCLWEYVPYDGTARLEAMLQGHEEKLERWLATNDKAERMVAESTKEVSACKRMLDAARDRLEKKPAELLPVPGYIAARRNKQLTT